MKKKIKINKHIIEYSYFDNYDGDLTDCDIEHITSYIKRQYIEGEIITYIIKNEKEFEYRGWWKIIKK